MVPRLQVSSVLNTRPEQVPLTRIVFSDQMPLAMVVKLLVAGVDINKAVRNFWLPAFCLGSSS